MMFFIWLAICLVVKSDLTTDRYVNAQKWVERTLNIAKMMEAYSADVTDENIYHTVQDSGDYGPKPIASEYDMLVLLTKNFIGYDPIQMGPVFDKSTTKWLTTDILQVDYNIDINTDWNFTSQDYNYKEKAFRATELVKFIPGTNKVVLGYSIQDAALIKLLSVANSNIPAEYLCSEFIFPACNGTFPGEPGPRPFLNDTGFTSVEHCITFMHSLPATNPCPFPQRSNTQACRIIHALSSLFLPDHHCIHVAPVSPTCIDSCLPACSNCHANAECVAIFHIPTQLTPTYTCKCKNGYVGNGTYCAPKQCSYGNCPARYGSYDCAGDNLCKCTETFEAVPQNYGNDLCVCPNGGQIIYNNSKPVCVPAGRCIREQWHCNRQLYNQVKCASPGPNSLATFQSCICNYGFHGGYEYPCLCVAGNRVVWSDAFQGEVCLPPTGCTVSWHCSGNQQCVIPNGQKVGTCTA